MTMPGETNGPNGVVCVDCGTFLPLKVCHSAAGYYLGYECSCSGPYSRESGYFKTWKEAHKALESTFDTWRRQ